MAVTELDERWLEVEEMYQMHLQSFPPPARGAAGRKKRAQLDRHLQARYVELLDRIEYLTYVKELEEFFEYRAGLVSASPLCHTKPCSLVVLL